MKERIIIHATGSGSGMNQRVKINFSELRDTSFQHMFKEKTKLFKRESQLRESYLPITGC